MSYIQKVITHPVTKHVIEHSFKFGATFGGIFGILTGLGKASDNIKHQQYFRPKFINPYVYFYGNLIGMPIVGGATGIIGGGVIGATFPVSVPLMYIIYKTKTK